VSPARAPVLIAEADNTLRKRLVSAFSDAGYVCVGAAAGADAVRLARTSRPLAAVVDIELPGLCGYEVCSELREAFGHTLPIIFVSGERVTPSDRVAGLLVGADDYLVKPFEVDELLARVRAALRRAQPANGAAGLTPREREVLRLLGSGLSQSEIAESLVISSRTVGTHIERILGKLGAHSRAQAVAFAYQRHLLRADD
jgi:DNA-binding NarL/FixJ family response regulator